MLLINQQKNINNSKMSKSPKSALKKPAIHGGFRRQQRFSIPMTLIILKENLLTLLCMLLHQGSKYDHIRPLLYFNRVCKTNNLCLTFVVLLLYLKSSLFLLQNQIPYCQNAKNVLIVLNISLDMAYRIFNPRIQSTRCELSSSKTFPTLS